MSVVHKRGTCMKNGWDNIQTTIYGSLNSVNVIIKISMELFIRLFLSGSKSNIVYSYIIEEF